MLVELGPKEVSLSSWRPPASSEASRRSMKAVPRRDTTAELAVRQRLHRRGLRYRIDWVPLPGTRRRADVVFRSLRIAVFVDGCFWHACTTHGSRPKANADWWRQKMEGTTRRDRETNEMLLQAGWIVVRIWEHVAPDVAAEVVELVVINARQGDRPTTVVRP